MYIFGQRNPLSRYRELSSISKFSLGLLPVNPHPHFNLHPEATTVLIFPPQISFPCSKS